MLHRRVFGSRVVLGDHHHGAGKHQADQRAAVDVAHAVRRITHQLGGDGPERNRGQHGRHRHARIERIHDLRAARLHEEGADDRRDDGCAAQHQREQHAVAAGLLGHHAAQQHGGNQRHRVGFEQVGRHAGAIAHVVAHVVGDHGRVARIIFRDARFHLAHQIGTHIRALGEDAAAQSRKNRDQRGTEGQAHQCMQRAHGLVAHVAQRHVVTGDAQQGQPDHQHAGDGAAAESHLQRRGQAMTRGLRRAHVRAHRYVHADIAGGAGKDGADGETDRRSPVQRKTDDEEQHDTDAADGGVLAIEIRLCTLLDRRGDLLHALVAR